MGRINLSELDILRRKFREAAAGAIKARMLKAAADEALKQVQRGFRSSVDPYGNAWKRLKNNRAGSRRRGRPLVTGHSYGMQYRFTARPTPRGFVIENAVRHVVFHQSGTKTIPARKMVPERGELSANWKVPIEAAVNLEVRKFFGELSGKVRPRFRKAA